MSATTTHDQPATEVNVATLEGINEAFNASMILSTKQEAEQGNLSGFQLELGTVASTAIDAHMGQFGVSRMDAIETLSQTRVVSSNGLFAFMAVGRLFNGQVSVGVHPQQLISALAKVKSEDRKTVWASIARQSPAEAVATLLKKQTPKKESVPRTDAQMDTSAFNSAKKRCVNWTPAQKAEIQALLSN